jgi:hypothetical protein
VLAARRLQIDPTPPGLVSGRTLRERFKYIWARYVREDHFRTNALQCSICAAPARREKLDGHEVYSYPDPSTVQLVAVDFLCKYCHDAIHMQRSRALTVTGRGSADYVPAVEDHYCRINGGLSCAELESDYRASVEEMNRLRDFYRVGPPSIHYGPFQDRVEAALARCAGRDDEDDDEDFEMFPDHECPWDIGMGR